MSDPIGAACHIRQMLAPDGTWMIVEPAAGNTVADNLNQVGRVYYSFSTFLCVPSALSQDGGYHKHLGRLLWAAGFWVFRPPGQHGREARELVAAAGAAVRAGRLAGHRL